MRVLLLTTCLLSAALAHGKDSQADSPSGGSERSPASVSQPSAGSGGEQQERQGPLSEVVVTAQKRLERMQDVPISVSVLGGDDLDKSTAQGVNEILNSVPGVATTTALQGGGTQLAIRGVTASSPLFAGSSPIAYYLDGVPFAFVKNAVVPDADVYDLQRVEVLRGPQGTLYGMSALNGVVRVLTNDPDFNSFGLKSRVAFSNSEHGENNVRADGTINVPIIDGRLAARASVSYQNLSGWIDKGTEKNANDANLRTARLKVSAKPTDELAIGLSGWLSRSDFGAPSFSPDNRTTPFLLPEPIDTDYDAYGLKIDYDFSAFSLASTASYFDYFNDGYMQQPAPANTRLETILKTYTFSEEVNLTSTHLESWRWTVGGIYRDSKEHQISYWPGVIVAPLILHYQSESFAVFGELTRLFSGGKLELTAGLRYFEDHLTETEVSNLSGGRPAGVYGENNFDAVSPRVILSWHPRREITVYSSYSQGFRSGLSPTPAVLASYPTFRPINPDKLKNYEIGAKGDLLNKRFGYEASVYYIDWKDTQQQVTLRLNNGVNIASVLNSGSASGIGTDLMLTARPTDGLTLSINFSWNDLTFDQNVVTDSGILLFPKGSRLNLSSEYIASVSAGYDFPFGGGYQGHAVVSGNYTSETELRDIAANRVRVAPGDEMLTGRASFSIDSPRRWTAALFVDNITNEQHSPLNNFIGIPGRDMRIRPRTAGLQVEWRY